MSDGLSPERKERIAEILVHAYMSRDDRKTAERYQVSDRSIRNWRARVETDDELARLFHEKSTRAKAEWAEEVPMALRASVAFLIRAAEQGDPTDPHMVHSVAGAMKLLSEVSATWKLLDVRMARQAGQDGGKAGQAPSGAAGHLRAVPNG